MSKNRSPLAAAFKGSAKRDAGDPDPAATVRETVNPVSESGKVGNSEPVNQDSEGVKPPSSEPVSAPTSPGGTKPQIVREEVETVPGPRGGRLPADAPVNLTFTVTAKERYLWNLELTRRGITGVSVLRRTMQAFLDEL